MDDDRPVRQRRRVQAGDGCVSDGGTRQRFDLGRVEITAVDEKHGRFGQRREPEPGGQRRIAAADRLREREAAQVARRRGVLGVEVAVRVEPDQGRLDAPLLDSRDDGERRHAVAAQHDRDTVAARDRVAQRPIQIDQIGPRRTGRARPRADLDGAGWQGCVQAACQVIEQVPGQQQHDATLNPDQRDTAFVDLLSRPE